MASFDAANVVEALEYTLRPYADVSGVIKEPTSLQVQAYVNESRREMVRMRRDLGDDGTTSDAKVLEALEKMDPERTMAAQKRAAEILSALCSGHPTAPQLMKLPYRVMHVFGEWIASEVLNPEAVTGAGSAQASTAPLSSAG